MYKPIFIAGPCVIETFDILEEVAKELVRLNNKYGINKKGVTVSDGNYSISELEKLSELKDKGIITQEEFDNKKRQILGY